MENNISQNEILQSNIEVKYRLPKFFHRVLANLIDIMICTFLFVGFFGAARAIYLSSSSYKTAHEKYENACLNSGLYAKDSKGKLLDLVTFFEGDTSYNAKGKKIAASEGIKELYEYIKPYVDDTKYNELLNIKSDFFLNDKLCPKDVGSLEGNPYFILEGNEIKENPVYDDYPGINAMYYNDCYKVFIDKYGLKMFQTYSPDYFKNINEINNILLFACIPSSLLLAGFLTWFVPPLFFRRGRKTLGKALYHIGLIDNNFLNLKFSKWVIRFLIFYFGEFVLSVVTLGIPYIVSFSLMAFSHYRQGFPDYMLKTLEVDTSNNKIYFDEDEIKFENINKYKKPIDFQMEDIEK